MRGFVTVLLIASLLAGCTSSDSSTDSANDDPFVQSQLPEATGEGNESTGGEPEESGSPSGGSPPSEGEETPTNQPPSIAIEASVLQGVAPLNITFTLTGQDVEGTPLEWLFDADGDGLSEAGGDALPGNATFVYEPGTYNATLWATDGMANVTEVLEIVVTAPDSVEHWYVSGDSEAGSCVVGKLLQDLAAAEGGLSCTFMGQNAVFGPTIGELRHTMTAIAPTVGHATGTSVEGEIYTSWIGAGIGSVDFALFADETLVGAGDASFTAFGAGTIEVIIPFSFETTEEIPSGSILNLQYTIDAPQAPAAFNHGTGPDAPSGFAMGGTYTPA